MSITSDTWDRPAAPYPAAQTTARQVRTRDPRIALLDKGAIGLAALLGGFVIREPAPYELFLLLLMALYVLAGMTFGRLAVMLAGIWVVFNFGGMLSMFTMGDWKGIPLYLAVSLFLGLTSVFWCAAIHNDPGRLRVIMRGYVIGAAVTALFGILGYFGAIPGAEQFTLYNRAKGLFQDPNVFGPFLVLPTLYLLYGLLYRSPSIAPIRAGLLLILIAGLFLSFSRAAWGLTVFASGAFFVVLLMTAPDAKTKFRLVVLGALGLASVVLLLVVALQFDAVSDMFSERAKVVQDYDGVRLGRFARHFIGFEWALSNPLGIGPLEFGLLLGEDTHNIYVKSLMAYGWIGFAAWMIMTIFTIVGGAALLGRRRPWQPYLQAAWCVFLGHIFVGWVIDLDHWRHVYLLIGIIWGCIALERKYQTEGTI